MHTPKPLPAAAQGSSVGASSVGGLFAKIVARLGGPVISIAVGTTVVLALVGSVFAMGMDAISLQGFNATSEDSSSPPPPPVDVDLRMAQGDCASADLSDPTQTVLAINPGAISVDLAQLSNATATSTHVDLQSICVKNAGTTPFKLYTTVLNASGMEATNCAAGSAEELAETALGLDGCDGTFDGELDDISLVTFTCNGVGTTTGIGLADAQMQATKQYFSEIASGAELECLVRLETFAHDPLQAQAAETDTLWFDMLIEVEQA